MEDVVARMQEEKNGIPIRTVKSFLSKIPSVISGRASSAQPRYAHGMVIHGLYNLHKVSSEDRRDGNRGGDRFCHRASTDHSL